MSVHIFTNNLLKNYAAFSPRSTDNPTNRHIFIFNVCKREIGWLAQGTDAKALQKSVHPIVWKKIFNFKNQKCLLDDCFISILYAEFEFGVQIWRRRSESKIRSIMLVRIEIRRQN